MSEATAAARPVRWPTGVLPITAAALAVLALVAAELAFGPVTIPGDRLIAALTGQGDAAETAILWQIRLPRTGLGVACGAALALAGAALQGLLRNPLAEPGLIGVTAGASLGAVLVIVLGGGVAALLPAVFAPFLLPLAAFLGGSAVIVLLFALARLAPGAQIVTLILGGIAINAIVAAAIGVLIYISDDQQLRDLTFWTMGSLATAGTALIVTVALVSAAMVPVFLAHARALDLMQLGERAAFHAGLDVVRTRTGVALATAMAVGAVTSAAGPIGFIGLVAPHMARMLVGPRHAVLLPMAALIGIVLVLAADLAVRLAVPPAEPPIGLATSLIGGPFFLWLILRQVRRGRLVA